MTETDWLCEFGENLCEILVREKMTQRELADKTGLSEATISKYVSGSQMPTARAVVNIAYALGYDVGELIDFYEPVRG